jgi:uncharacterized protein YecT (DUF1311 family)
MKNLIALPLLFVASVAFANVDVKSEIAQIEKRMDTCLSAEDGQSNYGMKACAGAAGDEFDALLNKQYKDIVKTLKAHVNDQYTGDYNKAALSRLVTSERAWVTFRDADTSLEGMSSFGGTQEGLDEISAFNNLTKARILQLNDLLGQ